jgi:signal peptidase I
MDTAILLKILTSMKMTDKPITITVSGNSMFPALHDADVITIIQGDYVPGDILVYKYMKDELLVHRLLKIQGGRYQCKGDFSFRLEDIPLNDIFGKITEIKRNNVKIDIIKSAKKFLDMSYEVGLESLRLKYDIQKIIQSDIYCMYTELFYKNL